MNRIERKFKRCVTKWKLAYPWLPLWGSCRACEAEGVSYRPKVRGLVTAEAWYHSPDGTPPDLAALGHPPQRGGREPYKFQFAALYIITKPEKKL